MAIAPRFSPFSGVFVRYPLVIDTNHLETTLNQAEDNLIQEKKEPHIVVNDMTLAYGSNVVQRNVSFTVNHGDVFIIMGGSGCGKSTTMRGLTGLKPPSTGTIRYDKVDFYGSTDAMNRIRRNLGVMFQSGALWSSMTLAENVALPLEQYTRLSPRQIRKIVSLKLSLVGLGGFENYYPSQISGGMRKRVGVARAMAMDPRGSFLRRTVGGAGSGQRPAARRPDPAAPGQPEDHHGGGDP